ncbi:MAG: chloride channel protein [Phycisphaerae bacterium]|nr:chloride channel protein [Phycisphaerae bacterium]
MNKEKITRLGPVGSTANLARMLLSCTAVGLIAGGGAALLLVMLQAGTSLGLGFLANYFPGTAGNESVPPYLIFGSLFAGPEIVRWMLLILPALGGLASGIITFTFAPEAEGHGTDAAIVAYHFRDGAIRKRVPIIKAISSTLTIGSGGSGGREGPIAQIGAGFGSVLGQWLGVPPAERRILMAAGLAAGIGAIFHAPLAGALFAAEVLYRDPDFEHEVLVPSFISSIVAYSTFGGVFGFEPLFRAPPFTFDSVAQLLPYLFLTGVLTVAAMLFVTAFYAVRDLTFKRASRIPNHIKPAIGGLIVGLIGYFLPEALGTGYGVVQSCLDGNVIALPTASVLGTMLPANWGPTYVTVTVLGLIAISKIATTSFTIGTGGSGGVFGPAIVIGGALGGMTGIICQHLFPSLNIQPGAFALVGMAGFFAGAANTPVSTIIMVNEMSGSYRLLIPSMLVCILCYILCRRFTLYREQLPSRLHAPSKIGSMANAVLRYVTVGDILERRGELAPVLLRDEMSFPDVLDRYATSAQDCFPVVDKEGKLTGVIDGRDIRSIIHLGTVPELIIAHDIVRPAITVTPGDSLLAALNSLMRSNLSELVVIQPDEDDKIVGTLGQPDIVAAYNRQLRT